MFDEGGGKQHNFTQAVPNEFKLGKGEYDERWLMAMGWWQRVFVRLRSAKYNSRFGASVQAAYTLVSIIDVGSL